MSANQNLTPPIPIWSILIFPLILVVIFFVLTSIFSQPLFTNINVSAATVLSIVGGIAVSIERIIEALWSFMDLTTKNSQWPINSETYSTINSNINDMLKGFVDKAEVGIKDLKQVDESVINTLNNALTEIDSSNILFLGSGVRASNFDSISSTVLNNVNIIRKSIPDLNEYSNDLATLLSNASDFVDTFKSNPGRRLFSILLGIILGLLITWVTGFDIFQATIGPITFTVFGFIVPHMGAALTGVALGLGASPTHEVIQLLSAMKQKNAN